MTSGDGVAPTRVQRAPEAHVPRPATTGPVHALVADEMALVALTARRASESAVRCDVCDRPIEGEPAGRGLYFWSRGGEVRWEEPALCASCGPAIGMGASKRLPADEEEG